MATDLANNPTRQQLDELDSLLQKMLAVPSHSLDEATGRKPVEKPRKPAAPPPAPSYSTAPPTSAPTTGNDAWAIDLNPRDGSSVLGDRSPLVAGRLPIPEPSNEPIASVAAQLQLQALLPPITAIPPSQRRRQPSLLMRPFANITEQFDDTVAIFGPLGRVARSGFGRFVMGTSGLLMLAGSCVYFAMLWYGWTR